MKSKRQQAILDIIKNRDIYTQEELTVALAQSGIHVAQATISRDIHALRLTKVVGPNGQKYSLPPAGNLPPDTFGRIFKDGLVSLDSAGNLLVLRTLSGMAMAVAAALDAMAFPEILGSVAGDDVIICVVKNEEKAQALVERLAP